MCIPCQTLLFWVTTQLYLSITRIKCTHISANYLLRGDGAQEWRRCVDWKRRGWQNYRLLRRPNERGSAVFFLLNLVRVNNTQKPWIILNWLLTQFIGRRKNAKVGRDIRLNGSSTRLFWWSVFEIMRTSWRYFSRFDDGLIVLNNDLS